MKKWKIISFVLTAILIPLIIGLIANYTTWLGTKPKVEITLKLDGWITIGSVEDSDLTDLKLIYKGESLRSILKLSWRVTNTGSEGIGRFESGPAIHYPDNFEIAEAKVTSKSPDLKLDKDVLIDKQNRRILVNNLGIFNSGDFFVLDVYITDIPQPILSQASFGGWELKAKSLNLQIQKDSFLKENDNEESDLFSNPPPWLEFLMGIALVIFFIVLSFGLPLLLARVRKLYR